MSPKENRKYEKSHSWIKFSVDLETPDTSLWIMLSECQSKCEHIRDVPILPETRKKLNEVYLAKGIHATAAIEGNPLSEEDVAAILDDKLQLPESTKYLQSEIQNILGVYNDIASKISRGVIPKIDVQLIKEINKKILRDLPVEDNVVPGEFTDAVVGIRAFNYYGVSPEDCEYLVNRLCDWLNGDDFIPQDQSYRLIYPIIKAIMAHLYLVWIHPFGNGNGRTARALEFLVLISSGVPATASQLLSNHYNKTRDRYYLELKRTSESGGKVASFIKYAVQGFLDGLREQVNEIQNQQWKVVWKDAAFSIINSLKSNKETRSRMEILAVSLFGQTSPLSQAQIAKMQEVVGAYSKSKQSALRHDIDTLVNEGILTRNKGKIEAHRELVSGLKNITSS